MIHGQRCEPGRLLRHRAAGPSGWLTADADTYGARLGRPQPTYRWTEQPGVPDRDSRLDLLGRPER
jgi:hypothetical protein